MSGAEWVAFDQVHADDELVFLTADNGFGGSGRMKERRGIVVGKTGKTVTIRVNGGGTARLSRADWSSRSPQRVRTADAARAGAEGGAS